MLQSKPVNISKSRLIYISLGSILLIIVCIISMIFAKPSELLYYTLRVLLSLGAAAFTIAFPGAIDVNWPQGIHAGGVFAVLVMIFVMAPQWNPPPAAPQTRLITIKGNIQLNGGQQSGNITNDLYIAVFPPEQKLYENGYFCIENVAIEGTSQNTPPKIVVLKKGYKREYVIIEENKQKSSTNKYIITKTGDFEYVIDNRTPIVLEMEKAPGLMAMIPYTQGNQPKRIEAGGIK